MSCSGPSGGRGVAAFHALDEVDERHVSEAGDLAHVVEGERVRSECPTAADGDGEPLHPVAQVLEPLAEGEPGVTDSEAVHRGSPVAASSWSQTAMMDAA